MLERGSDGGFVVGDVPEELLVSRLRKRALGHGAGAAACLFLCLLLPLALLL